MAVVLCAESQVSSGNGGCSVGKGWEDRVAQVIKDKHPKTASGKPFHPLTSLQAAQDLSFHRLPGTSVTENSFIVKYI